MNRGYYVRMRTVEEFRQRWLKELPMMFTRPGMCAHDGRGMELMARARLYDLCFLDEREDDLEQIMRTVRRFGQSGVQGPFSAIFGRERQCREEVASVFAEQFHRLGYLTVDRVLDSAEWAPLTKLRDWVADRDIHRSEVETVFGPPSLIVGQRVLCYVPADATGWVFVDCWNEATQRYMPGKGMFDSMTEADPLVRDIRVPAKDFEEGLILTLYGRVLRWGPGWWIHHPGYETTEEIAAIAAQLRQIESNDPSQGRRRLKE